MPVNLEIEQEVFDRLLRENIGSIDLGDAELVDRSGRLATANSCYRSCVHSMCLCLA